MKVQRWHQWCKDAPVHDEHMSNDFGNVLWVGITQINGHLNWDKVSSIVFVLIYSYLST